jgi:hypothetical protein
MRKKFNINILNGLRFPTNVFFCFITEGKFLIARRISTVHDVRIAFLSSVIINYYKNNVNFSKSIFEFLSYEYICINYFSQLDKNCLRNSTCNKAFHSKQRKRESNDLSN